MVPAGGKYFRAPSAHKASVLFLLPPFSLHFPAFLLCLRQKIPVNIYILKMVEAEIRQRNVASKQPDNVNPFTADKIDDEDKKRGLSSATLIFILVGGVAALIFIVSPLLYFFYFYLDACRRAQKELFTPSKHQRKGYRNVGISPIIFLNFSLF